MGWSFLRARLLGMVSEFVCQYFSVLSLFEIFAVDCADADAVCSEPNPCTHGRCTDGVGTYVCDCYSGWTGTKQIGNGWTNCSVRVGQKCSASNTCDTLNGYCKHTVKGDECICHTGYTLVNIQGQPSACKRDHPLCASKPCHNGAKCIESISTYVCTCTNGFTGSDCRTNIDECYSMPCKHSGTCTDGVAGYTCACISGWRSLNCNVDDDECFSRPCQNFGSCDDSNTKTTIKTGSYVCTCIKGFTGSTCAVDTNECGSRPCKNRAVCRDSSTDPTVSPGTFECQCTTGYRGKICETNLDECDSRPCRNEGQCVSNQAMNTYTCKCSQGFSGINCHQDIDECLSKPCQNSATCLDSTTLGPVGPGYYSCSCSQGFYGNECSSDKDECANSPCQNGQCKEYLGLGHLAGGRRYQCECSSGYTGLNCQININECVSVPCQHGSTCIDLVNGTFCRCSVGFTGPLCDSMIVPKCQRSVGGQSPCLNGGTCHASVNNSFWCECPSNRAGKTCEQTKNAKSQAENSKAGGYGIDITHVFSDNAGKLHFKTNTLPLFLDTEDKFINYNNTEDVSAARTTVMNSNQEFLQFATEKLGLPYSVGDLSNDAWASSVRQRSFSGIKENIVAVSERTIIIQRKAFKYQNLTLHPDFVMAIEDELPQQIYTEFDKSAYFLFIQKYGTHFPAVEERGGVAREIGFLPRSDLRKLASSFGTSSSTTQSLIAALRALKIKILQRFKTKLNGPISAATASSEVTITVNGTHLTLGQKQFSLTAGFLASGDSKQQTWNEWQPTVRYNPSLVSLQLKNMSDLLARRNAPGAKKSKSFWKAVKKNLQLYADEYRNRCPTSAQGQVCSGHGNCDLIIGACTCDPTYYGNTCEKMHCPLARNGTSGVQLECGGHGTCNRGICQCFETWSGTSTSAHGALNTTVRVV